MVERIDSLIDDFRERFLAQTLKRKAEFHDEFIKAAREPAKQTMRSKEFVEVPGVKIFGCSIWVKR